MPLYEYYCMHCDGIFEALRPMRQSSDPVPCPECDRDGERIMPTSINAFTLREGYPRRLPDKGTYWHLGKEVKSRVSGPFRPFEHPEINKPEPRPSKPKGEVATEKERDVLRKKELKKIRSSGLQPNDGLLPKSLR